VYRSWVEEMPPPCSIPEHTGMHTADIQGLRFPSLSWGSCIGWHLSSFVASVPRQQLVCWPLFLMLLSSQVYTWVSGLIRTLSALSPDCTPEGGGRLASTGRIASCVIS
jgi:hypothetical protein